MALYHQLHLRALLFLFAASSTTFSDGVHNKIYYDFTGKAACVRLLNATHQIGCQSSRKGNVGVLFLVRNETDLELINEAPHEPYTAIVPSAFFKLSTLKALNESNKVNGVLVIEANNSHIPYKRPDMFSADYSCPNNRYDMYTKLAPDKYGNCEAVEWNSPYGEGIHFYDWHIPIFVLTNSTEIAALIKCYNDFNLPVGGKAPDWPLCSAHLGDRMNAAVNSETCLRRHSLGTNMLRFSAGYCDPLGDKNIWAALTPINKSKPPAKESVIIVAARMDTFSMFDNLYPGANSAVTGIVAVLAAAEALGKHKHQVTDKHILFTFFQGEAFDYIGSGRMVYDMRNDVFPNKLVDSMSDQTALINLEHISAIVEVSQIGRIDLQKKIVWAHTDPITTNASSKVQASVANIINLLKHYATEVNLVVNEPAESQPLPPASTQSFLKFAQHIAGVVLADHENVYTNKFYNSRLDTAENIDLEFEDDDYDTITEQSKRLANVATLLARTLYSLASDNGTAASSISADVETVTHLLYCFLYKNNCELLRTVVEPSQGDKLHNGSSSFYVTIGNVINQHTIFVRNLLAYFLGERTPVESKDECKQDKSQQLFTYFYMRGPKLNETVQHYCVTGSTNFSLAAYPVIDDLDSYNYSSNEYPIWAESVWSAFTVRIFLQPSWQHEVMTLSVGVVVLAIAVPFVYIVQKNVDTLFTPLSDR